MRFSASMDSRGIESAQMLQHTKHSGDDDAARCPGLHNAQVELHTDLEAASHEHLGRVLRAEVHRAGRPVNDVEAVREHSRCGGRVV